MTIWGREVIMRCIGFEQQERQVEDFIRLGHSLYDSKTDMQNDAELRSLLLGEHILSGYFQLYKFCIYREDAIVGRFVFTEYPGDDTGYFGFFECEEKEETAKFLFEEAENFARTHGFSRIIGPVDASFWIKYRLKTNLFDRPPYTGEPYNQPYYLGFFLENGYEICHRYSSSIYRRVPKDFRNEKFALRKEEFEKRGYRIQSPSMGDWERTMREIHGLLVRLYSDFPIYKEISEEDFCRYFSNYKKIIDLRMVKMAYYRGSAVGFYISLPNYGNLVHRAGRGLNLLKILKLRYFPKEYVMLYMGAEEEHKGLGKALAQSIVDELCENGLPSIGALQREGKVTRHYVEELIRERCEYLLLGKELL